MSVNDVANSSASTGLGIISSLGIGSGLNASSIISQLMAVQDEPVNLLQNQEAGDQTTVSAFGSLQSALSQFQTSLQSLNNISQYQSQSATIANSAVATVSATSAAAVGTYSLQVNQLAQSQTLIAAGQASTTSAIGVGTISFNLGTTNGTVTNGQYGAGTTFTNSGAAAKTVTITSADDSLTGIAAAINAANIGVTASILNDGSSTPNRLSLTSTATGAANSLQISVSGDPALSSLLDQDPTSTTGQNLTQTSAAQNAQFTLNGLAISSSTNTDSTVIPGVTLNLLSTNLTSPTTLSISQTNTGTVNAINSFVKAYNTIESTISQATAYDSSTKQSGPLQGQNSVVSILSQMQGVLDNPVPGASSTLSMLAQVGVSFNSDGTLSVNSTTLQTALASNPTAVAGLFASTGSSTDSLINYTGTTSATQPGAYAVNISQLATQANTAGSAAANLTITSGVNDTLQVDLNGVTSNVTLAAGTYTSASLADALQTAINTNNSFTVAGGTATVTQNGGVLTITSNLYGSKSAASITGGDGESDLLGGAPITTAGVDVAGTINGVSATGSGQTLTSILGNSTGLSVLVNGGGLGSRGTINYTQGYINELNNLMTSVLGKNGQIASATAGLNATITGIQSSVASDNNLNQQILTNLQAEYSALDVTISKLTSTQTFLTQQLASLSSSSSSG
ncbi:flagellar filament capping protein FliD [Solimicrobium silvestre]|uniref:Flagellar hook-associated protein 2 n=1 Tax=Solimicrobium silvestre TaxID=2099400 RepID=A0A2S9GUU8_9BURK|nr:flagellar filament capping protein FliD [Solimicrobium silvestre]PRC91489.1 Flagellar hook-associated protein 2 C-terminus [Solimicrobium silvestre]